MSELVTLHCLSCGGAWQIQRRKGQYPNRCVICEATEIAARRLVRRAKVLGLRAQLDPDHRLGYVAVVATPFHDELVIVRDDEDLEWVLTEIRTRTAVAA